MTIGRFISKSILYVVLMNTLLFLLCAAFEADFEPTLIGNLVVPVLCAYASTWAEGRRITKHLNKMR